MNDDSLKKYLKENSEAVPSAALGEASRIWQNIDKRSRRQMWGWMIPILTTAAGVAFVMYIQTMQKESKVEEDYLYQEWNAMMSDVNSDIESDLITAFEK